MTTGQTTNETGIPYTWVHKGILKHFPMHSEGTRARERERERERKKERVSECCVCTQNLCCFEGRPDGDEQGDCCWTLEISIHEADRPLKIITGHELGLCLWSWNETSVLEWHANMSPRKKTCKSQNLSRKSCWSLLRGVCKIAKRNY